MYGHEYVYSCLFMSGKRIVCVVVGHVFIQLGLLSFPLCSPKPSSKQKPLCWITVIVNLVIFLRRRSIKTHDVWNMMIDCGFLPLSVSPGVDRNPAVAWWNYFRIPLKFTVFLDVSGRFLHFQTYPPLAFILGISKRLVMGSWGLSIANNLISRIRFVSPLTNS